MNRLLALLLLTTLLVPVLSCAAKKPVEQTVYESKNVLTALRGLTEAYEKKDLPAFMDALDPAYQDRINFSKSIEAIFSKYDTIRFRIQYSRTIIMMETQGPIKASFNWDADWVTAGGAAEKDGGRVTMVFKRGSFKLLSIDGKDPFVPHPAEIPISKE